MSDPIQTTNSEPITLSEGARYLIYPMWWNEDEVEAIFLNGLFFVGGMAFGLPPRVVTVLASLTTE